MSISITDRAALVLREIDDATAEALAWENLAWEKSLRCLKTAIEGLLEIYDATDGYDTADVFLTAMLNQWEATK